MSLARYQFTVTDYEGNVVPNATVEVRREAIGSPIVSLYSDRAGSTPIGNPFNADTEGFAAFHVGGGAYKITATSGAFSRTWRYVGIGLASESDSLTTGIAYSFDSATADADPGSGNVRFNNAALASVTEIYFDNEATSEVNVSAWLDMFDDGGSSGDRGVLTLFTADATGLMVARVTGSVVDGTGYRKVSVTPLAPAGTFIDGANVNVAFGRSGEDGIDGIMPGVPFNFDSATSMADPGTGEFRLNNATLSSVTAAAFDDQSAATGNPDVSAQVLSWDDSTNAANRGFLLIKKASASQNFALYKITGASTDNSGWTQLALTHVASSGSFTNADPCFVEFASSGDQGTTPTVGGYRAISGADTVIASDANKLIEITSGTFTLAFTPAATLGSAFVCEIKNSGTGNVALDPDSAELIDGLANWILYPGGSIRVYCTGTTFHSVLSAPMQVTFDASGTFTKPGVGTAIEVEAWGGGGSGGHGTTSVAGGGGGGGGRNYHVFPFASVGTTETITIGAGGPAQASTSTSGTTGGQTNFGSLLSAFGGGSGAGSASGSGGGGGGQQTNGSSGSSSGNPGQPRFTGDGVLQGAGSSIAGGDGSDGWIHGGGGGGGDAASGGSGGDSSYGGGGGGGGGDTTAGGNGGTSTFAGNGGAGATGAAAATAGTQPSGGGGGSETGNSGAGANGRVRVRVY
jgi:hypothetical protein